MTRTDPGAGDGGIVLTPKAEHSLRNHLAIVIGFCEVMMQDDALGSQARADLNEIHQAALAALDVVKEHQA